MLKPRKRLTRRQIKEDKLLTTYVKTTRVLRENVKFLIGGAILIVVLILAIRAFHASKRSEENKASVELARGKAAYESSDYTTAIDILRTAVEDYGDSKNGTLACLYLANSLYEQGEYYESQQYYQRLVNKIGDQKFLASSALAGIAACLEQSSNFLEAAGYYEKAATEYSNQIHAAKYLLGSGRCYILAGKKEEAIRVLKELMDKYPNSSDRMQAELYLGEISS